MEPKSFGFHKTEGANNHIKQGDAFFFARNPIGVTYNQLPAMLTNTVHKFPSGARSMPYQIDLLMYSGSIRLTAKLVKHTGLQEGFCSTQEISFSDRFC